MKEFKCPSCKRVRFCDEDVIMKICYVCQCEMEVIDDGSG